MHRLFLLIAILPVLAMAQVPPPANTTGSTDLNHNWIIHRTFDPAGNPVNETKRFFDNQGNGTQAQVKRKVVIGATVYTHVLANQTIYDELDRPAMTTMSAPIDYANFKYQPKFISKNNIAYSYRNYDRFYNGSSYDNSKINNPDVPDISTAGTLGWYYSTNNTWEPYTATTGYPFSRKTFYNDGSGDIKKLAGEGESYRMGSGHEVGEVITPVINELNHYLQVRNKYFTATEIGEKPASLKSQATRSVKNDANGREIIAIADKNGKILMKARPGSDLAVQNTVTLMPGYRYSFQGNGQGQYAKELKVTTNSIIKIWSGTSSNPYTTVLYHGPAGSYSSGITNLTDYYTIEGYEFFQVSYQNVDAVGVQTPFCVKCPAEADGQSTHYFKLFTSGTVTIDNGFLLYDMSTEQNMSFGGNGTLSAGYYKVNNAGIPGTINLTYSNSYSDISYNFYNHLGQLIASITPEGVKKLLGTGINNYATLNDVPFVTTYEYDVSGRLIKEKSVDAGYSEFVYRKDGKVRFSQNAQQRVDGSYSYTNYDSYGRAVEAGEYKPGTGGIAFNADMGVTVNAMRDMVENVSGSGGLVNGTKTFVIKTTFDAEDYTFKNASLRPELEGYMQDFLRDQVSVIEKLDDGVTSTSKTWFSYDEQGRISWVIRYLNGLGYKTSDNTYDVLGKLTKHVYQKGTAAETFVHYYEYTPDQELHKVYTNTVDNSSTKVLEATYVYYLHGPLKRVELATNLQGIDYVYTLQGELKSINNSIKDKTKDPGQDAVGASAFLEDAFGMTLDYYTGDYVNTRSGIAGVRNMNISTAVVPESYTGNIKAMTWYSKKPASAQVPGIEDPTTYIFKYDDKYQFTESIWGNGLSTTLPSTYNSTTFFKEKILHPSLNTPAYDLNGNIQYLQRTNATGTTTDQLQYNYVNNTNKLQSVVNTASGTQTLASFTYNNIGQVVTETSQDPLRPAARYTKYDVSGKVTGVYRNSGMTIPAVTFTYDEKGERIAKTIHDINGVAQQVLYYVGDFIYSKTVSSGVTTLQEIGIRGSDKLGIFYKQLNIRAYELTDHLGNVRAVIAKNGASAYDIRMYTDYYPFGFAIRRAGINDYRYAFQGEYAQEDAETGWNAFELRMYDSRIARWMSKDPDKRSFSPYTGMGNDPVSFVDPDGAFPKWKAYLFAAFITLFRGGETHVYQSGKEWLVNWTDPSKPTSGITTYKNFDISKHLYVNLSGKVTVGAQIGIKNPLFEAEAGYKVYTLAKFTGVGYDGRNGGVKSGYWEDASLGNDVETEDFIGIEAGLDKFGFDKLKFLKVGAKWKRIYKSYHGYNGPREIEGSSETGYEFTTGPASLKKDFVKDALKGMSIKMNMVDQTVPESFQGIQGVFGGKLLLGTELKAQIGIIW